MRLTAPAGERAALEAAPARIPQVRHWRREQAVVLRAEGRPVAAVGRDLGGTEPSVSAKRLQVGRRVLAGRGVAGPRDRGAER